MNTNLRDLIDLYTQFVIVIVNMIKIIWFDIRINLRNFG